MIELLLTSTEVGLATGVPSGITEFRRPRTVIWGALGTFLTTLILGAILIAIAPEYTEQQMAEVIEQPVEAFLFGLIALVVLVIVVIVLVLTILGILVAIPLLLLAYLAWAVGATIAFLSIGDRLVGREDGWTKPLLVAASINGGLALTGVGGIISFVIGAVGFGVVLEDLVA